MFIQIIFEITTNHNRHCEWTQCQCTLEKKIKVLVFFSFFFKKNFFLFYFHCFNFLKMNIKIERFHIALYFLSAPRTKDLAP